MIMMNYKTKLEQNLFVEVHKDFGEHFLLETIVGLQSKMMYDVYKHMIDIVAILRDEQTANLERSQRS